MPRKKIEPPAETPRVELPPLDTGPIFEQLRSASRVIHGVAKCRWCGGRFVFIFDAQWICETAACAERQIAGAIQKPDFARHEGQTPFAYLPLPLQIDMSGTTFKRLLVAGAAGACKSYGARWELYKKSLRVPGNQSLLLRCTYPELEKNHLKYMEIEQAMLDGAKFVGGNSPKMKFENGSLISMGYCKDAADVAQHLGAEWDDIVIEEGNSFLPNALTEIPARDRGSFLAQRNGAPRDGRTLILANPGGRGMLTLIDHYIKRDPDPDEFPAYNRDMHGFIHATLDDNPYLSEDYAARTLGGLTAARYKQLRYGDWTVTAGQFFSAFTSETHIVETR